MSSDDGNILPFPANPGTANLKGSGGDGTSGDMEARVSALEAKFDKIDAKLDTLGKDVAELKGKLDPLVKDVAEIKGKISNMPATWQIVAFCAALIALVIASGGGVVGLMRLLQP